MAIVNQPTPVFGGKAWSIPLSPVAPSFISFLYVGMAPALAYFSIRSGRMPSDANITTLSAGRSCSGFAPAAPAPNATKDQTVYAPALSARGVAKVLSSFPSSRYLQVLKFTPSPEIHKRTYNLELQHVKHLLLRDSVREE